MKGFFQDETEQEPVVLGKRKAVAVKMFHQLGKNARLALPAACMDFKGLILNKD